jgi:hypothetical protein
MAIVSVDRIGEQRVRNADNLGQGDIDLTFRVRTSTPLDGQSVVLTASGPSNQGASTLSIPPAWAAYGPPWVSAQEQGALGASIQAKGAKCLCTRRSARQTDNDQTWQVTCTFSASNPLNVPWKITFQPEQVKQGIDADVIGNLIRNSFGDPFVTAAEVETTLLRMHVVANFATYDPLIDSLFTAAESRNPNARQTQGGSLQGLQNVGGPVNIRTWWGFPVVTVRYRPGATEFINEITEASPYWRREFDFLINPTGWHYRPLDCGFRGLSSAGVLRDPFLGNSGQRRSQPALLDGLGKELATDNKGRYIAAPVFLDFTIYPPKDFAILGLGTKRPW